MPDDGIPARIEALDKAWEWVSDAPSRLDAVNNAFSELKSRLEKVQEKDPIEKAHTLVDKNEEMLPDLSEKLEDAKKSLEDADKDFGETSEDLTKRVQAIKTQVGA